MNVLILGGNGFIGSHLVDYLLLKNHKVRVFDVGSEKFRNPLFNVDYRVSDMDNIPALAEALIDIDIVIHLASSSLPSTSNLEIISDIENNIIPTIKLLNLCVKQNIKKVIFLSSGGAVYGNVKSSPIKEEEPLNPISSYGILKAATENYIKLYKRLYDLDYLIIRPSNPYGPRQGHHIAQGVISTFLKKIMAHEPFIVYGDGLALKDYIYIEDFIKISYELIKKDATGIFNIGSGKGISLNEIIETIKKVTEIQNDTNYHHVKKYDVPHFVLDISKSKEFLNGDFPNTSIENGIKKTWDWLQSLK